MQNLKEYFETLYQNFNDRKIELVLSNMTDDVQWANGMEGGYVLGKQAVKEYWLRQFSMVSSKVSPSGIKEDHLKVSVKVHQVVHDLDGNLLGDEMVEHIFKLRDDKIAEFHIGEK